MKIIVVSEVCSSISLIWSIGLRIMLKMWILTVARLFQYRLETKDINPINTVFRHNLETHWNFHLFFKLPFLSYTCDVNLALDWFNILKIVFDRLLKHLGQTPVIQKWLGFCPHGYTIINSLPKFFYGTCRVWIMLSTLSNKPVLLLLFT